MKAAGFLWTLLGLVLLITIANGSKAHVSAEHKSTAQEDDKEMTTQEKEDTTEAEEKTTQKKDETKQDVEEVTSKHKPKDEDDDDPPPKTKTVKISFGGGF